MKFLKNKWLWLVFSFFAFFCCLKAYCALTGNDHEPQRNRPAQARIGKICDVAELKKFGAPAQSGDAAPFYIDDEVDGFKPARESTLVRTFSNQSEIHQYYIAACKKHGFSLAQQQSDFDVACSKRNKDEEKSFIERLSCDGHECKISLELLTSFH